MQGYTQKYQKITERKSQTSRQRFEEVETTTPRRPYGFFENFILPKMRYESVRRVKNSFLEKIIFHRGLVNQDSDIFCLYSPALSYSKNLRLILRPFYTWNPIQFWPNSAPKAQNHINQKYKFCGSVNILVTYYFFLYYQI